MLAQGKPVDFPRLREATRTACFSPRTPLDLIGRRYSNPTDSATGITHTPVCDWFQKRLADRVRPRNSAKSRENPLVHQAATLRIRAVLLTFYRNKNLNKLTRLTQPLT